MSFRFQPRNAGGLVVSKERAELPWVASGSDDEAFVRGYALQATPNFYSTAEGTLYRDDVQIARQGYKLFYANVTYSPRQKKNGAYRLSFDTTGGTFRIKASHETIGAYPEPVVPLAPPPDHHGAIGVNGKEVEGVDIVIPSLKETVHFRHAMGFISQAQIKAIARLTGCVNSDTFLTYRPGEVLFLGGQGSEGTDSETEVGYHFAMSENLQDQLIGGIEVAEKQGWDVAWVQFEDEVDDGRPVRRPQFIYVERVYRRVAMADALGFGG